MKSVKHMTNAQIKRIQENNYCSEHDSKGKQFDYEANGYRDEIDARLWELSNKKVDDMMRQARTIYTVEQSADKTIVAPINMMGKCDAEKTLIKANNVLKIDSNNQLERDICAMDTQLSVMRAFNPWRYVGNELMMKYSIDK